MTSGCPALWAAVISDTQLSGADAEATRIRRASPTLRAWCTRCGVTSPATCGPLSWAISFVELVQEAETKISTIERDAVISEFIPGLLAPGYDVESGKTQAAKIRRPVLFGENGNPGVNYEIGAFYAELGIAVEVEAGCGAAQRRAPPGGSLVGVPPPVVARCPAAGGRAYREWAIRTSRNQECNRHPTAPWAWAKKPQVRAGGAGGDRIHDRRIMRKPARSESLLAGPLFAILRLVSRDGTGPAGMGRDRPEWDKCSHIVLTRRADPDSLTWTDRRAGPWLDEAVAARCHSQSDLRSWPSRQGAPPVPAA